MSSHLWGVTNNLKQFPRRLGSCGGPGLGAAGLRGISRGYIQTVAASGSGRGAAGVGGRLGLGPQAGVAGEAAGSLHACPGAGVGVLTA